MKLKTDTHVLVCDGGKYLLLQNAGDEDIMNLTVLEHREAVHEPASELVRDRPGTFHGGDTHRGGGEPADPHEQAKYQFVQSVVERLDKLQRSGAIHRMIIMADQRSLGYLRDHVTEGLQGTIVAEISADHAHQTVADIEVALKRASP